VNASPDRKATGSPKPNPILFYQDDYKLYFQPFTHPCSMVV